MALLIPETFQQTSKFFGSNAVRYINMKSDQFMMLAYHFCHVLERTKFFQKGASVATCTISTCSLTGIRFDTATVKSNGTSCACRRHVAASQYGGWSTRYFWYLFSCQTYASFRRTRAMLSKLLNVRQPTTGQKLQTLVCDFRDFKTGIFCISSQTKQDVLHRTNTYWNKKSN